MSGAGVPLRGPPLIAARASASANSARETNSLYAADGADTPSDSNGRDGSSAAVSSTPGPSTPSRESRPGGRPKRTLIESACAACRRRKSRCDGIRPACSRCQTLRTECAYEAEEGESRWSALRRRNQLLENERNDLRDLFHFVQTRPEGEALEIFARIRMGGYDDVFALLRQMRDGDVPVNMSRSSTPARAMLNLQHTDQRLPPIRTMFDVSGPAPIVPTPNISTHTRPQMLTPEHSRGSTSSSASIEFVKLRPPS